MRTVISIASLIALTTAQATSAAPVVSAAELKDLRQTEVGGRVDLVHLPLGTSRDGRVHLKRIEIYAPGAKILVPDGARMREVPRSDWLHFIVDRAAYEKTGSAMPQLGLSVAPDGSAAQGVLFSEDGITYSVLGESKRGVMEFSLRATQEDETGKQAQFACQGDKSDEFARPHGEQPLNFSAETISAITGGSRSAVVAVDTDNEFMQQKFSNNTTNATNYLAQLFVGFNVIYGRDLDLTLNQGTTILRVSTTADPYSENGVVIGNQLDEFGEVWAAAQSGVNRAFSVMLSGKSPGNFNASGIAWVLGPVSVNYCTQRNIVFNGCGDGQCTAGHYSVSQVFKFAGSDANDDLLVVAHELGHNFGAEHAHCSDATTGNGPQATNTIDQCYNDLGTNVCYAGPRSCPAAHTENGVAGVQGTLMSYCHIGGSNGVSNCTSTEVFATAHRTLLNPRVTNNVTLGCFTSGGGGPDQVFRNSFE